MDKLTENYFEERYKKCLDFDSLHKGRKTKNSKDYFSQQANGNSINEGP